jgi:hypothetical protein
MALNHWSVLLPNMESLPLLLQTNAFQNHKHSLSVYSVCVRLSIPIALLYMVFQKELSNFESSFKFT